jgi:C4-dicarboxylate transporter DctM subunit
MVARGYSRGFAAALLAVAGTLALLMPLSIPFLVYAFISGVSMRTLSMAGLLPALATALALIVMCMWHGKKTGVDNGEDRSTPAQIWSAAKDAGPALLMPVIIVGGIWSGQFTPSESAAVAVFYGLAVSLFYYKDLTWRHIPQLLLNAFSTSATVMLVIGATGAMAWLITVEQVAVQMAEWIQLVATEQWMFLILFNICLLLLGIFIEPLPAMLLSAPLFLPLAKHFGMDMVQFESGSRTIARLSRDRAAAASSTSVAARPIRRCSFFTSCTRTKPRSRRICRARISCRWTRPRRVGCAARRCARPTGRWR